MSTKKRPVEFIESKKLKSPEERKKLNEAKLYYANSEHRDRFYDVKKSKGLFHQWGLEIEEGETEISSYTIGIIEDENGQIHTPKASDVKFLDKQ